MMDPRCRMINFTYIKIKTKLISNDWLWVGVDIFKNVEKVMGGYLKLIHYIDSNESKRPTCWETK